jgi:hypothetical protein
VISLESFDRPTYNPRFARPYGAISATAARNARINVFCSQGCKSGEQQVWARQEERESSYASRQGLARSSVARKAAWNVFLLCCLLVPSVALGYNDPMATAGKRNRTHTRPRRARTTSSRAKRPRAPIWKELLEIARAIPKADLHKLPTDLATHHDHYLYGGRLS